MFNYSLIISFILVSFGGHVWSNPNSFPNKEEIRDIVESFGTNVGVKKIVTKAGPYFFILAMRPNTDGVTTPVQSRGTLRRKAKRALLNYIIKDEKGRFQLVMSGFSDGAFFTRNENDYLLTYVKQDSVTLEPIETRTKRNNSVCNEPHKFEDHPSSKIQKSNFGMVTDIRYREHKLWNGFGLPKVLNSELHQPDAVSASRFGIDLVRQWEPVEHIHNQKRSSKWVIDPCQKLIANLEDVLRSSPADLKTLMRLKALYRRYKDMDNVIRISKLIMNSKISKAMK